MKTPLNQKFLGANRDYAVSLAYRVCCFAGDPEFLDRRRRAGNKRDFGVHVDGKPRRGPVGSRQLTNGFQHEIPKITRIVLALSRQGNNSLSNHLNCWTIAVG